MARAPSFSNGVISRKIPRGRSNLPGSAGRPAPAGASRLEILDENGLAVHWRIEPNEPSASQEGVVGEASPNPRLRLHAAHRRAPRRHRHGARRHPPTPRACRDAGLKPQISVARNAAHDPSVTIPPPQVARCAKRSISLKLSGKNVKVLNQVAVTTLSADLRFLDSNKILT
jgi:hypothetical protein